MSFKKFLENNELSEQELIKQVYEKIKSGEINAEYLINAFKTITNEETQVKIISDIFQYHPEDGPPLFLDDVIAAYPKIARKFVALFTATTEFNLWDFKNTVKLALEEFPFALKYGMQNIPSQILVDEIDELVKTGKPILNDKSNISEVMQKTLKTLVSRNVFTFNRGIITKVLEFFGNNHSTDMREVLEKIFLHDKKLPENVPLKYIDGLIPIILKFIYRIQNDTNYKDLEYPEHYLNLIGTHEGSLRYFISNYRRIQAELGDMHKRVLNSLIKLDGSVVNYVSIMNDVSELSQDQLQSLVSTPKGAKEYVYANRKTLENIPESVLRTLAQEDDYIAFYANRILMNNWHELPKFMVITMMEDFKEKFKSDNAYGSSIYKYFSQLRHFSHPLPEYVIEYLQDPDHYDVTKLAIERYYAYKKVPSELLPAIWTDPTEIRNYGTYSGWDKVPKSVRYYAMREDSSDVIYSYVKYVAENNMSLDEKDVEIILQYPPNVIFKVASALKFKNLPKELENAVIRGGFGGESMEEFFEEIRKSSAFIDIPDSLHKILKNNLPKQYNLFYERPKKMAEEYNTNFDGYFFHSAHTEAIHFTIEKSVKNEESNELCISSFRSVTAFNPKGIVIIAKGNMRMLFDFDCYSYVSKNNGYRYATEDGTSTSNITDLDEPDYKRIAKKIKSLDAHEYDIPYSKEKVEKEIEKKGDSLIVMNSKYYDEGFIKPKDAEIFAITKKGVTKEDPDVQKILQTHKHIQWINYNQFEKMLKEEWQYTVKKLDQLYDAAFNNQLEYDDEELYQVAESSLTDIQEDIQHGSQMDLDSVYDIYKKTYDTSVGKSWDKDHFVNRAKNWKFYGDNSGYVSVREQKSGFVKLTGMAGDIRGILKGFNELEKENKPIWGVVTDNIVKLAQKKNFIQASDTLIKLVIENDIIPQSLLGDGFENGAIMNYGLKKYFIANKKYYERLLNMLILSNQIPKSIKDSIAEEIKSMLKNSGQESSWITRITAMF